MRNSRSSFGIRWKLLVNDTDRERFELDCRLEDLKKMKPLDEPPPEYRKKFRTVQAVRNFLIQELKELEKYKD